MPHRNPTVEVVLVNHVSFLKKFPRDIKFIAQEEVEPNRVTRYCVVWIILFEHSGYFK
jgi:hypothetical protein